VAAKPPLLRWHLLITREIHRQVNNVRQDDSESYVLEGEAALVPLATGHASYTQATATRLSVGLWAGSGACGNGAGGGQCTMDEHLVTTAPGTLRIDHVSRTSAGDLDQVRVDFSTLPVETLAASCTGDCGTFTTPFQDTMAAQLLAGAYPDGLLLSGWTKAPEGTDWVSTRDVTTTPHPGWTDRVKARWSIPAGPEAKPGTYTTPRAQSVTLDATASTDPSGTITDYDWDFVPGPRCPPGTVLTNTEATGKTVSLVPLCDLDVTLTVTDDQGLSDSATTRVTVTRRGGAFARTPVRFDLSNAADPRRPTDFPTTAGVIAGRNVSACTQSSQHRALLCPFVPLGQSHRNKGFTIDTVTNQNGPFDGFAYISGTTLRVRRLGLLNPTLSPHGARPPGARQNWHRVNTRHRTDIQGLITSVEQHEGMGAPGRLETGHTGLMLKAARTRTGNINARLEPLIGPDPATLTTQANKVVDHAQARIHQRAQEAHLQPIGWTGNVRVWNPATSRWVPRRWTN
jgi:hypothetical protein